MKTTLHILGWLFFPYTMIARLAIESAMFWINLALGRKTY